MRKDLGTRLTTPVIGALAASLILTGAWALLRSQVAIPHGLNRSVYPGLELSGEPSGEAKTTTIDLDFLKYEVDLPPVFSVRWSGYWFALEEQRVTLQARADGRVSVYLDAALVLRHDAAISLTPVSTIVTLTPGAHQLVVDYEHQSGDPAVRVQWTGTAARPRPLPPGRLFTRALDRQDFYETRAVGWFGWVVFGVWLTSAAFAMAQRLPANYWRTVGAPRSVGDFGRRLHLVVFPALLGPAVLFFLGPHTIYNANLGEFSTGFTDIAWPWLLLAVGGGWTILLGVGCVICLLSDGLTRLYASLLLALGLLFWAQGNLWVGDYGVLDGRAIDWARLAGRVPYELVVWTVIPLLAVVFWRSVSQVARFAAQLFLVLQAGALAITWAGPDLERPIRWEEPPPELFQFSPQRNVIHIVLDEFQSDVFAAMLESDPTWFDRTLPGFTFFADHLGAFPSTSLSMPAMLTGKEFRNEQRVRDFVRQAFSEWSIFSSLNDAGYVIDATSIMPTPWFEDWFPAEQSLVTAGGARFSIPKPFVSRGDYREFTGRQLLELSVSRHVPHIAKVALSDHPEWFDRMFFLSSAPIEASRRQHEASNSAAFFEQFIDTMSLGRDRPVYKLLHVGLPHRPIVLDAECGFIDDTPFSPETYLGQSWCAIKLVGGFLDRLRDFHIYDSSLIVLSSDHGTDLSPFDFTGRSESLPLVRGASIAGLSHIVASSRPLMAIKPPSGTGPLMVSQAPTAQADVPVTMLALLGLSADLDGESMFERDAASPRDRVYGMYDLRWRFPEAYLNRLDLLTVERISTDATGWNLDRSIMSPEQSVPAADVDLGGGRNTTYLGPGWSRGSEEQIEGAGIVSFVSGISARAVIFASLPREAVALVARLSAPRDGGLDSIAVTIDGREIERWGPLNREGYHDYSANIPADPTRPSVSTIAFHFDAPTTDAFVVKLDRIRFHTQ